MRHYAMNAILDSTDDKSPPHTRENVQLAKTALPDIYKALDKLPDGETKVIVLTMMFFDYALDLKYEHNAIKTKFDVYTAIETFFEGPLRSLVSTAAKAHMDKVEMSTDIVEEFLNRLVGKAEQKVH